MREINRGRPLSELDAYIQGLFVRKDPVMDAALHDMQQHGLPEIHVSPTEGKLLYLLTKMARPKKALEIGTLGGYSTIWMGRALPEDGKLVSLEIDSGSAEVAKTNIARAGLSSQVEVRVGNALEVLPQMRDRGEGPFDLIFIDAEKEDYVDYLDRSLELSRPGTIILSDNLIRNGEVTAPEPTKESYRVLAEFNRRIADNPNLESLVLPLINREIIDGIGITIVKNTE